MLVTRKWDCIRAAMVVIALCCCLLACSGRQRQWDVASLPRLVATYADRDARPWL